ncbi:hypothetical protein PF010_g19800 [Phytophthora fragariae]|uniref:Uncharacterized protein n=1 Tax=Phytophthora fragariae TaxID=53985 RepID=A0A6G0KGN4_9STRA|nr:hypothetical protein PF010_g19800 [Phytophthora fragariae]KAE9199030.1 hypothetical protein PF004_g19385 [Phytophthora fragariae]
MVAKRTRGSGVDASNDGDKGKGHDDLPVGPRAATPAGDAAPPAAPASTGKVQAVSASSIGAAKHDRAGGKSSGEGGAAGPAALAGPAPAAEPAGSGPPAHAPAATALATFARATGAAAAPKAKRKLRKHLGVEIKDSADSPLMKLIAQHRLTRLMTPRYLRLMISRRGE